MSSANDQPGRSGSDPGPAQEQDAATGGGAAERDTGERDTGDRDTADRGTRDGGDTADEARGALSAGPLRLGPRSVERPADGGHTLVAGLDGATPARVDGGGLVTPHGALWSVDWWIGADDRWHLPAREPSVRQRRVGYGPVIETALRVPSGDVTHTAYPVIVDGRTTTVVEVYNDSPVPVALALALRPYGVPGPPADAPALTLGRDGNRLLIDGQVGVVLPREPNEAGAAADIDLLASVSAGEPLTWSEPVSGPTANAVVLYPLPHKTSLRFAVPGHTGGVPAAVDRLADPAASARGWTAIVERAARFEFPDPGVTALAGASRARLLLEAERLGGRVLAAEPGAGLALQALAAGGHQVECGWALDALGRSFPARLAGDVLPSAEVVAGAAAAAELIGERSITDALMEPMTQLTHLIERSERKDDEAPATVVARRGLAELAELTGQTAAAEDLRRRSRPEPSGGSIFGGFGRRRRGGGGSDRTEAARSTGPARQAEVAGAVGSGGGVSAGQPGDDTDGMEDTALDRLMALGAEAAPAGRWNPDDSATTAARYWLAARDLLVRPGDGSTPAHPVIELLPTFPTAWRGGPVEVHQAPVCGMLVSFAIRWHGYRPALLWDVAPHHGEPAGDGQTPGTGEGPGLTLTCPGLDPSWRTTEQKGETLLAGVAEELPDAPAPGESFH
ncbi:MAG: hypothetical protein AAGA65_29210 [Actinomycetota bacterium]